MVKNYETNGNNYGTRMKKLWKNGNNYAENMDGNNYGQKRKNTKKN